MTRLLRVELTRLWWRRLPLVGVLGIVVVLLITMFGVHQTAGGAARALAGLDQDFNAAVADWEVNGEEMLARCQEDEEREREISGQEVDFGCEFMGPPTVEDWFGQPPSVYEQVAQLMSGLSWVLLSAVIVIGCSSVTKELAQRTLGTWLTFEPRRGRVFLSKLVAAAAWAVPLAVVLVTGLILGSIAVLSYNGVPDGVTTQEWSDLSWSSLRLVVLAVVMAAVAAAAGFVVRNVAVLIGLGVGYAIAVESILANLVPSLRSWTVSKHVSSWVNDGTTWVSFDAGLCDDSGCPPLEESLTLAQSSAYLGVGALVVVAAGYLVMRRTDFD